MLSRHSSRGKAYFPRPLRSSISQIRLVPIAFAMPRVSLKVRVGKVGESTMKYERLGAKRTQEALLRMAFLFCLLHPGLGAAQQSCVRKSSVEGIVSDPTGALIAGAQVESDEGNRATTDPA